MRLIEGDNVNDLYAKGLSMLVQHGRVEQTRAGKVLVMPEPVTSVYRKPRQRVLFNRTRDANPFFHVYEAMWMLAGKQDAGPLNIFVKDFGARFAEDDGTIHGAYGRRWRGAFGFDQLNEIVAKLKQNPADRQCVLQMWSAHNDLRGAWRDRPCNTHCYFRILDGCLHMQINCRSNDIIFGAYGANAVHFSFLQEYLADRIGVEVGTMTQVSFNYHAYADVLQDKYSSNSIRNEQPNIYYEGFNDQKIGLMVDDDFDTDLIKVLGWFDQLHAGDSKGFIETKSPFLRYVFQPMMLTHYYHVRKDRTFTRGATYMIEAADWRIACLEWLNRRNVKSA
jgi:thymidylate synthase